MRIAFVAGNRENLPDPVVPIGLLYVMAATPDKHPKKLIDLCFAKDPFTTLDQQLRTFDPDLVAVGMRNIQNSDYTDTSDNLAYYARLVEVVRVATKAPIVFGGGGFSVLPQALMRRLNIDYGISGEGEGAWGQLLDALEAGEGGTGDLGQVSSLHRWVSGELVSNPSRGGFANLDDLAWPDRRQLDKWYYEDAGIENIQTKRGCALRCDYCTYPSIEGRVVRKRDAVAVVDEMQRAIEQHERLNHFFFVDSVFNIPPAHAKSICREMANRDLGVPWTCYANPLGFDQELAGLMAESKCVGMEIGADSGSDEILKRLRKGFNTAKIRDISRLSKQAGLKDCQTFILGTQGETMEHVRRTLEFCEDLDPWAAIFMIWIDDYEALEPGLADERRAFRAEITELMRRMHQRNPRWIIPTLSYNFDPRLFRVLRRRGLHGPLWQHIDTLDGRLALPALGVKAARRRPHRVNPMTADG